MLEASKPRVSGRAAWEWAAVVAFVGALAALVAYAANNVWTVAGSVSGTKADAIPGTAYDNGIVGFTITHGATPPANGASITFDVEKCWAKGDKFTFDATHTYDDYREKLAAPGASGIGRCTAQAASKKRRSLE